MIGERVTKSVARLKASKFKSFSFLLFSFSVASLDQNGTPLLAVAHAQEGLGSKATIVIESISNSSATRGKKIVVTQYRDEQCSRLGKTEKVFRKNYAKDLHSFSPLEVEIDRPFIFQVSYTEKRRDEIRSCAAISNVSLKANHSYKATFNIVDEVIGCNISVYDVTDIIQASGDQKPNSELAHVTVLDRKPEFTCKRVGKQGYKNGAPVYSFKDRLG